MLEHFHLIWIWLNRLIRQAIQNSDNFEPQHWWTTPDDIFQPLKNLKQTHKTSKILTLIIIKGMGFLISYVYPEDKAADSCKILVLIYQAHPRRMKPTTNILHLSNEQNYMKENNRRQHIILCDYYNDSSHFKSHTTWTLSIWRSLILVLNMEQQSTNSEWLQEECSVTAV